MIHTRQFKSAKLGARSWRLCVAALLLFVVNVAANAYDFSAVNDDGVTIYYNISGLEATVTYRSTNYNSYSGNVVIPDNVTYDGKTYTVVSIGVYAFYNCTGLTSVTIPESVTKIGNYAFQNCSGLTGSLTIPNSVTEIGNYAFYGCTGLTGSLTIPESVTTIGSYAFRDCTGLTSVTIPESVTEIGELAFRDCTGLIEVNFNATACTSAGSSSSSRAFYGCNNISTVNFGDNVTIIPDYLCYGLTGLTQVTIPNSVETIGDRAFNGCTGLIEVNFNATACTSVGYSSVVYAFYGCYNLLTFNFGDNVTIIPAYLCYNRTKLTEIIIPNSVTEIGDDAFEGCTGLTEVTIGNSVETIGSSAFEGCTELTGELVIPNSVTTICNGAFYKCAGLTAVIFGSGVTTIGDDPYPRGAFESCSGLTEITIPSSVTAIGGGAFEYCSNMKRLTIEDGEETLVLSTKYGSYSANPFNGCPIETLYLGRVLSYNTDYRPFQGNTALTSLIIGNGATSVNGAEFVDCTGLAEVTICSGVISMGGNVFGNCTALATMTIEDGEVPLQLNDSARRPFEDCPIETLYLGRDLSCDDSYTPFYNKTTLTSLTIGESVTSIGNYAFYKCTGLEGTFTIPNGVVSIGNYAFNGCTGLTRLTLGESVSSIGDYSFQNCTGLVGKLTITENVTTIGRYAFDGCAGLTGLTLGERVTSIGYCAFQDCKGLVGTLVFPNSLTSIGNYAFCNCSGFSGELSIPENVTSIGYYAFQFCRGITKLAIGENVKTIGEHAFYGCTSIEGELTIPNSTTSIGKRAFARCSGLTKLTIGGGVKALDNYEFAECSGVKTLVLADGESPLSLTTSKSNTPFEDCPIDTLYVGRELSYSDSSYPAFQANTTLKYLTIDGNASFIANSEFKSCDNLKAVIIGSSVESMGSYAFQNCSGINKAIIGENVASVGNAPFNACNVDTMYILTRLDSYSSLLSGLSSYKVIYAHKDQIDLVKKVKSGTVLPLEMDYIISVVSTYPRSLVLKVVEDGGLDYNATIDRVEIDGQESTADADGLYVATGLMPNTSYVCKLYYNSMGSDYTDEEVVTTEDFAVVALQNASTSSVTFAITLNEDAYSSMPDEYGFMLGSTYYPADEDGTVTITGLEAETEYTFTAYAKYNDAVTEGESVTVTTQEFVAPTVETCEATDITSESATLHGIVVAGTEEITEQGFEYWTENSEAKIVTVSGEEMSVTLNDLTPGTTYFFRIYATAETATTYGETMTFTTPVVAPAVQTALATDITYNSATLNGTVVAGSEEILERGFEYWYADGDVMTVMCSGEEMSVTITGLKQDTQHTYHAYARTESGTTYGEEMTFTTETVVPPTVRTYQATEITYNSALFAGFVTAGEENVLEQGFEYWCTDGDIMTVICTGEEMSVTITGLKQDTKYSYRAYAKTESGTTYGEEMTFTTETAVPPTVETYEATDVTYNSAALNGYVEAGDEEILECGFEYWTNAYDVQTVTSTGGNLSVAVANLKSNTKYTYRAYAKTASGTTYGEDMTFTTETIVPPTVQTYAATNVTESSALLSGYVEAGSEEILEKGFEYWAEGGEIRASGMAPELPMEITLAGLDRGTTYTYRAYARTASGKTYGENVSFTTLTPTVTPPTVQTYAATEVTDISATLNGVITTGDEEILEHGFEYWSEGGEIQSITTRNLSMTVTLTELMPDTKYTYRAFAKTESGTTYGVEVTFTTLYDLASVYAELEEAIEEMNDDLKAAWKTITTDYPDAEDDCMDYYDAIFDKVMDLIDLLDSSYRKGTLYDDVVEEIRSGIAEGERMIEEMLEAAKKVHETGIEDIIANCGDDVRVYDLAGRRVHRLERGNVYIIRYSDGTSRKVLVK